MAIKMKAVERNVSFHKGVEKWAYVLQADLYSKLSSAKVIQEAALRSGINKGAINAAWDAIGEVIKAWATEGHSVAIPGLGSMRFGVRSSSVANVNKVGTSINITCYNRLGEVVKRVNASGADDEGDYEVVLQVSPQGAGTVEGAGMYDENETAQIKATPVKGYRFVKWSDGVENAERNLSVTDDFSLIAIFEKDAEGGSNGSNGSSDNTNQNPTDTTTKYTLSVSSNDANMGTVTGGGEYAKDATATQKATPKSGYLFDQWSDGNKNAERTISVTGNQTLVATFYQEDTQRPSEVEPELPPAE